MHKEKEILEKGGLTKTVSRGKLTPFRGLGIPNPYLPDRKLAFSNQEGWERVMSMPLTMAQPGVQETIKKVGGKDEVRRHLESLGFVEGTPVTVVSRLGGNLIVHVKDARVALSMGMANRIMV